MWTRYRLVVLCAVMWFGASEESEIHCDGSNATISTREKCRDSCEAKPSSPRVSLLSLSEWERGFLSHIQDTTCRSHMQQVVKDLDALELWALKMLDSSGRVSSHLLSGNAHQLGDYDQCLSIDHAHIRPQYCLALIDVAAAASAPDHIKHVVKRVRGNDFIQSHRSQSSHFVPTYSTVKWGLCIPSSCSPSSLSQSLNTYLNITLPEYVSVQTSIEQKYCTAGPGQGETQNWPLTTYLSISMFASIFLLALVSTYLDRDDVPLTKLSKLEGFKVIFSLKRSWRQFFHIKAEDIACIHGLRSIATLMIFTAHNIIPLGNVPYIDRTNFTSVTCSAFSSVFRSSIVFTNSFLYLSGLLSSYYLQTTSSILVRLGNRVLRMWPALVVIILFSAYVMPHLNSGPLWSYIVESNAELCAKNGWRNLLFIQNFFPFEEICATHTHQLALDIHLFLMTIPLVLGLRTHPVFTSVSILLLNLASAGLRYATVKTYDLSVVIYTGVTVEDLYRVADLTYILPIHRASPYLSGLWVGFLLYKIRAYPLKLSKGVQFLGWTITSLCLSYCLLSNYHVGELDYRYNAAEAAQYAALEPLLTSVALSWVILVCSTGYGGYVNAYLSSRIMGLLSKLSFYIYLVQFCVFFYNLGILRTSRPFSYLDLFALDSFLIVVVISFLLTLLIDLPVQNLKALIFR